MSYPYCYLGPTCQLEPFFMMKCKKQPALVCPIGDIGASACPMAAFSGFYESHEPLPSSDMQGIVLPHCNGHQNGHQSGYILHFWFVFCHPGGRRDNRASSCLMAASSGFGCSPGYAASGDATYIPSTPLHDHQNVLQRRCICSSPPPFLFGIIKAKDHGMVHLN